VIKEALELYRNRLAKVFILNASKEFKIAFKAMVY
jgi:hypothetical protein